MKCYFHCKYFVSPFQTLNRQKLDFFEITPDLSKNFDSQTTRCLNLYILEIQKKISLKTT
jgi:hypothetical protein